jgi:O-acetyl-ADP-ribose deacetylase (regulator of RNase III)
MRKPNKSNCLLFAIKYRLGNSESKIRMKWNSERKLPAFIIKHKEAIIRYKGIDKSQSSFWFEGKPSITPIEERGNFTSVQGDLLQLFDDGCFHAIAHGCNLRGTLARKISGGLAGVIEKRYLEASEADNRLYRQIKELELSPESFLGSYTRAAIPLKGDNCGIIYNLYTQVEPGADFRIYALQKAVQTLNEEGKKIFNTFKRRETIGVPLIGGGIGGGNKDGIIDTIKELSKWWNVVLVMPVN